ncbi:uncharacterized protein PRCAT00000171001 [Priceomyces carsonii]|uniref:uncharacterized protein n=1 Tax=Priceomyces carsonii TaxID=28549 RepID=UPI002EDAF83B|nr:unnamed protein product [Priceomyces carsonii]
MSQDLYTSPVIVGHRGFKAKYTENTLEGFNKCFDSGATCIETDLWKTLDDVLVISHDANTKRVFCHENNEPADYHIPSATYDDIKDLKTIGSGEKLLKFTDVLKWYVEYVEEKDSNVHKLQLDIKKENPVKIVKLIVQDLLSVRDNIGWWLHRIQFGTWNLNVLKFLNQDPYFQKVFNKDVKNKFGLKQFDIFHISFDWRDSIHFINYNFYVDHLPNDGLFRFKLTGVSLVYISTWSLGFLTKFVPLLKVQDLKLYSWTINTKAQYEYLDQVGRSADLKEYGVVTDLPDYMVEVKNGVELEDSDMDSELTRLTSSDEFFGKDGSLAINLSIRQRLAYSIMKLFQSIAGPKRISDEEKKFNTRVDENSVTRIRVNLFYVWAFRTCQSYGIF